MKKAAGYFATAFVLAAFACYFYFAGGGSETALSAEGFKPKAGSESLAFRLPDMDEQPHPVGGGQGKLQFVNFWASWCGPCELEAPDLQKIYEKYGGKLIMYGLNSTKYDKERAARQFVADHELTFPILMDRDGNVTDTYKVETFPTTFLIDQSGVIRERINGVIPYEEWERLIEKYI
ncbi:TlpA family protein disulfide reductase [Paenibacillus thailandensis]|uniref:TlpA family protein disulfide reductase n=1 Tax=Paenibacillus thailandensis TaxID=393250 RepID=A0ABW5QZ76_9BACL